MNVRSQTKRDVIQSKAFSERLEELRGGVHGRAMQHDERPRVNPGPLPRAPLAAVQAVVGRQRVGRAREHGGSAEDVADVAALERTGTVSRTVNLYADLPGFVIGKTAVHGMRVTPRGFSH